MPVRMKHPEHGWTHAYTPYEVEELKKLGWEVEEEKKEPEKRKPGRPKGS